MTKKVNLKLARGGAWLWSVVVVFGVAAPGFLPRHWDSFPLSNYPMFSQIRSRVETLPRAVGVRSDGSVQILSPNVFGTDNTMQAISMLWKAVRQGNQALLALCQQLAQHRDLHQADSMIDDVQIVLARYDVLQFFASAAPALDQQTLVSCEVQRHPKP